MGELGDLLELLQTGGVRDTTVRATIETWVHHERSSEAFRAGVEEDGGAVFTAYAYPEDDEEVPQEATSTHRLWLAPPDRAREEHDDGFAVRRGALWWRYSPSEGAVSNEDDPEVTSSVGEGFAHLLDPGSLLGSIVLEPVGRGELRGREVVLATARPRDRRDEDQGWTRHHLGFGADEWRLAVDVELGVLVRLESLRGGEPFSRSEILELEVGRPIDDEVFVFVPPPGEEVQPLDFPRPHHSLAPDELAELAPFPVFLPDRVGADWEVDLHFQPGSARRQIEPTAHLHLRSDDGLWNAAITQTASDAPEQRFDVLDEPERWRTETRGGRELRVREPSESWEIAVVRTEIDGTRIDVTSQTLGVERLAELAERLVRAEPQQPEWE
ncbi:MAG TPA: hypothetical protein VF549_05545 [Solirubrobacteraceae bacterium]